MKRSLNGLLAQFGQLAALCNRRRTAKEARRLHVNSNDFSVRLQHGMSSEFSLQECMCGFN